MMLTSLLDRGIRPLKISSSVCPEIHALQTKTQREPESEQQGENGRKRAIQTDTSHVG